VTENKLVSERGMKIVYYLCPEQLICLEKKSLIRKSRFHQGSKNGYMLRKRITMLRHEKISGSLKTSQLFLIRIFLQKKVRPSKIRRWGIMKRRIDMLSNRQEKKMR
jgi:hypothetical protein